MKQLKVFSLWAMILFTSALFGQQTPPTPKLGQLTRIQKQQIEGAFCEAELQQCDSSRVKLLEAVKHLKEQIAESKNELGAEKVKTDFYKQDAADSWSLYQNALTEIEKCVKRAGRSAFFAWLTPIALAVGFIVGVSQ